MEENNLNHRLREFIENETRSCSMDFGCITPEYVYKMWGGFISIEEIENGFKDFKVVPLKAPEVNEGVDTRDHIELDGKSLLNLKDEDIENLGLNIGKKTRLKKYLEIK